MFLTPEELAVLTGRKTKSKQIEQLRRAGIPFRVNATGHAVVVRSAVDGSKAQPEPQRWIPRVVGA